MLNWALHYWGREGSEGTAQSISNIDTRWRRTVRNWTVLPRNTAIYYHSYASIKTHQIEQFDDSCRSSSHTSRHVPVIWWAVLQKLEKFLVQYHLKYPTNFTTHSPASDNNTFSAIANIFFCLLHIQSNTTKQLCSTVCVIHKNFFDTEPTQRGWRTSKKNSQLV